MAVNVSTRAAEIVEAATHLPPGSAFRIGDVTWEEYEETLVALESRPNLRLAYRNGALEIMTLSKLHESLKTFITRLLQICSEEYGIDLETCGSTTYRSRADGQGVEPDECVYIGRPERVVGKERIVLGVDPSPELVVEIDITHGSTFKLDLYARYGVAEIWLYSGKTMTIRRLIDGEYREVPASGHFPEITADLLSGLLERSQTEGQSKILREFRTVLQTAKSA